MVLTLRDLHEIVLALRREEFGSVIYHDISRLGMMSTFISL